MALRMTALHSLSRTQETQRHERHAVGALSEQRQGAGPLRLTDFLTPEAIEPELHGRGKASVLRELAVLLAGGAPVAPERLEHLLAEREALASTGVGGGVAVPHCKVAELNCPRICVGLSRAGLDFDAMDKRPVHIFVGVASPASGTALHLRVLSRLTGLLRDDAFRESLLRAEGRQALYSLLAAEELRHLQRK